MKIKTKKQTETQKLRMQVLKLESQLATQRGNLRRMHQILCEAVTFTHAMAICELVNNGDQTTACDKVLARLGLFLDAADRLIDQRDL